jgi:peptidoglycan/LPS O-acetylase OafA/YrhL
MKKVPALDGLRGIAILLVFAHHYGSIGINSPHFPARALAALCTFGWSGVDLFFVLSGFLITGILYDTRSDPGYYKKFYARRALRIFPVYYLFALIMFLANSRWTWAHLTFLFYVGYPAVLISQSLGASVLRLHIFHLWSLAVEEQFYGIWPWLLAKLKNPLNACLSAIVFAFALRCAIQGLRLSSLWSYTFLLCRVDSLAVGSAIALLLRRGANLMPWAPRVLGMTSAALLAICILQHTANPYYTPMLTAGPSLTAFAYGALLLIALAHGRFFQLSVLRMFGKYSYGIYLFHFPLIPVFEPLKPRLQWAYVPFCLLANLAIAATSFHLLEEPILRLKKYFSYAKGEVRTGEIGAQTAAETIAANPFR